MPPGPVWVSSNDEVDVITALGGFIFGCGAGVVEVKVKGSGESTVEILAQEHVAQDLSHV